MSLGYLVPLKATNEMNKCFLGYGVNSGGGGFGFLGGGDSGGFLLFFFRRLCDLFDAFHIPPAWFPLVRCYFRKARVFTAGKRLQGKKKNNTRCTYVFLILPANSRAVHPGSEEN